jgi:beta-lactamase class A
MLSESDNTASNIVLRRIGFAAVNSLMQKLEAHDTRVERMFSDEQERKAGKDIVTSPRDMALLLRIMLRADVIGADGVQAMRGAMARKIVDSDKIPKSLPPNVLVFHKTGVISTVEQDPSGGKHHDVGIVEIPRGRRYIVVFLSTGVTDDRAAIDAIARASEFIYKYQKNRGP